MGILFLFRHFFGARKKQRGKRKKERKEEKREKRRWKTIFTEWAYIPFLPRKLPLVHQEEKSADWKCSLALNVSEERAGKRERDGQCYEFHPHPNRFELPLIFANANCGRERHVYPVREKLSKYSRGRFIPQENPPHPHKHCAFEKGKT